jgi:putative ABC transport system ATP-binding protein
MTLLSLDAVTRRHRAGRETIDVLRDVTLEVWPGDLVAIRGGRRSGKTTLLRVAAGIEAPDVGSVRLHGLDLAHMTGARRARLLRDVGYAPREWRVAGGKPVVDHVALPLLAVGRPLSMAIAKAHEAIERVGAAGCAEAAVHELGPGELARVALARALVRGPRLLLVDEPGASADAEEREEILRLLRSLVVEHGELAAIVVSREAAALDGAQRVMSIGAGRVRTYEQPAAVIPFPARQPAQPAPVP